MKATEKMLNKLVEMGMAKEWIKGDMHRYYIQLGKLDEAYEGMADAEKRHARLPLNRREREDGKLWIEADTLEIHSKYINLHIGDEEAIMEILEDVTGTAAREEAVEEAVEEATEANDLRKHIDFTLITIRSDANYGKLKCTAKDEMGKRLLPRLATEYKAEVEAIRRKLTIEAEARKRAYDERQAKIDAIDGLHEIINAIMDWNRYNREFNAMMDDEFNDGAFPPKRPTADVNALKAQYPRADAYLTAQSWTNSENYAKAEAGAKALERIINGDDYAEALADMDAEWSTYCDEHMWD